MHPCMRALGLAILLPGLTTCRGPSAGAGDLPRRLRELEASALSAGGDHAQQLARYARKRLDEANRRESEAWRQVHGRADWERYRDARLRSLRASLGVIPPVARDLKTRLTRSLAGDGFRVENLVFESRPGLVVTANLYLPSKPAGPMPGLLICHSHHNPKTQGELQDMGILWARLGCAVLVMDQLGHGERRQHPFRDATSYPHTFRPGRQDYYFRYNAGLQLHVIGDSLIGWMVWDLRRGVDLLLARPGIDKERIVLLGAVAGGGDPAAVAAALDPRIAAVVPFNFGGPQPETAYPLPADAEDRFNYAGTGSWESTRNLRLSARDGFLPWVIVGAIAPRRLIYAHEFAWDRRRDPVWRRLERVYSYYDVPDRLAAVQGRGKLSGKPPESTHCNNIGPEHLQGIYPPLRRWFGMPPPAREETRRHPAEALACLEKGAVPRPMHELAAELGAARAEAARRRLAGLTPTERRRRLRQEWAELLGTVQPGAAPVVKSHRTEHLGDVTLDRTVLEVEPGIVVPLLVLAPQRPATKPVPVVVALAERGKQAFLKGRSADLAELLQGGVAVCLPDLRGTGETAPAGAGRGRVSASTALSASELMLGETMLGSRLRDLRGVLRYLRGRPRLDAARVGLWGDSFAAANPGERPLEVPLDADRLPDQAEPGGALLALFGALFEEGVRAVFARGGLTGYAALLDSPFCYVPHDAVVPGALTAGDIGDVAAALAPQPLRLAELVDGRNRRVPAGRLAEILAPVSAGYAAAGAGERLVVEERSRRGAGQWLLDQLREH
jgi:dienelactone hydrolase